MSGGGGGALLEVVIEMATRHNCARVWLVTNDNLDAHRFYRRKRFRLVGIARDAVACAPTRKPSIPFVGARGIRVVDEIELD